MVRQFKIEQDLVFNVELHQVLGLIPYLLILIPYPLVCSLSPSTVHFQKIKVGALVIVIVIVIVVIVIVILNKSKVNS